MHRQACLFRDLQSELERPTCASSDQPQSRNPRKIQGRIQSSYVLLSDEQKTVIKMYGLNGP